MIRDGCACKRGGNVGLVGRAARGGVEYKVKLVTMQGWKLD